MAPFDEKTNTYDRSTFLNRYRDRIIPKIPNDVENADTQIALLKTLSEILPMISAVNPVAQMLLNQNSAEKEAIHTVTVQIATLVNATIGASGSGDDLRSELDPVPDDKLIDAYILLDYYSFIIKSDGAHNLLRVEEMIALALQKRFSPPVEKPELPEEQPTEEPLNTHPEQPDALVSVAPAVEAAVVIPTPDITVEEPEACIVPEVEEEAHEEPAPEVEEEAHEEPIPEVEEEAHEEPVPEVEEEVDEEPAPEVEEEAHEEPVPEVEEEVDEEPAPEVEEEAHEEPAPEVEEEAHEEPVPEVEPQPKEEANNVPQVDTYEPGVDYIVHYNNDTDTYLIEIHDATGKYLSDASWHPGKIGYAVFALTEDEYKLKNAHGDEAAYNKLNALIKAMLENLPGDRLRTRGYIDKTNRGAKGPLYIRPKTETIDGGVYQKYLNLKYLNSLDKVYVIYTKSMGAKFPAVDGMGYAWIYSKTEYAENTKQRNAVAGLDHIELTLDEFKAYVKTWYTLGIMRFKLNVGANDNYMEFDRDDFVPIENIKRLDYIGSALNQFIIRCKQNSAIANDPNARAAAMNMRSAISRELYGSVFLVPVVYDDGIENVQDRAIHPTQNAVRRLLKRQSDQGLDDGDAHFANTPNKIYIHGSEKYHFAQPNEEGPGVMHLRTLVNNNSAYLCAFTDFDALHAIFGENVRVGLLTYEDIIAHMGDAVFGGGSIQGLVINPSTTSMLFTRDDIAAIARNASLR